MRSGAERGVDVKKHSFVVVSADDSVAAQLEKIVIRAGGAVVSRDLREIPKGAAIMLGVHDTPSLEFALAMKKERNPSIGLVVVVLDFSLHSYIKHTRDTVPNTRIICGATANVDLDELAEILAVGWVSRVA